MSMRVNGNEWGREAGDEGNNCPRPVLPTRTRPAPRGAHCPQGWCPRFKNPVSLNSTHRTRICVGSLFRTGESGWHRTSAVDQVGQVGGDDIPCRGLMPCSYLLFTAGTALPFSYRPYHLHEPTLYFQLITGEAELCVLDENRGTSLLGPHCLVSLLRGFNSLGFRHLACPCAGQIPTPHISPQLLATTYPLLPRPARCCGDEERSALSLIGTLSCLGPSEMPLPANTPTNRPVSRDPALRDPRTRVRATDNACSQAAD
jgi:hypothetical protein